MSRKTNRTIETLAAVFMAATLAPSASLAYQDLHSQDALDAARSLPPDQLVAVSEGLRSTAPKPTIVRVSQSDGFDWPSAVLGATALLGLIGVSLAVLLGVRQIRRRPTWLTDSLLLSTHADGERRASITVRGDEELPAPAPTEIDHEEDTCTQGRIYGQAHCTLPGDVRRLCRLRADRAGVAQRQQRGRAQRAG